MGERLLEIGLFGACMVRSSRPAGFEITGSKHKALFALLATAPFGRRTRAFLQESLWGTACYDSGRQSLRRALSDIKQIMGEDYPALIAISNSEVGLDLDRVKFVGRPGAGEFLEGIDLKEEGFNRWLTGMRLDPAQVDALYSVAHQPPRRPVLPVIAVIPFHAISADENDAVLADWLAEEVARSLSRSNLLSVISHLSSRRLSSTRIDILEVQGKLGVDFCVSGSIRRRGDTVVLDADFVDVESGMIVWTRRFEGSLDDFVDHDSRAIANIVRTVGSSIVDEAIRHVCQRELASIEDHRLLSAGVGLMHRPTRGDFERARPLIDAVIENAPRSAEPHAWLGKWHILSVINGWSEDPAASTMRAVDRTARALDIDPHNAFSLTIDGFAHNNLLQRLDIASSRYDEALRINPNESLSWLLKGMIYAFTDRAEAAVDHVDHARRLSPMDPFDYFYDSLQASALLAAGEFDRALALSDRSLERNAGHLSTIRARITALHALGRDDDAQAAASDLMRRQPDCTVSDYLRKHPAGDYRLGRSVAEAMDAAGIPMGT